MAEYATAQVSQSRHFRRDPHDPRYEEAVKAVKDLGVQTGADQAADESAADRPSIILTAETAAAFDDLTREGVKDGIGHWPTTFREGRFITAVDYIRANRLRTLLMREMAELW